MIEMPVKFSRTEEDHLNWCNRIKELDSLVKKLTNDVAIKFPRQHRVNVLLTKMVNSSIELKSHLDSDFHFLINDEQHKKLGNVYYGNHV